MKINSWVIAGYSLAVIMFLIVATYAVMYATGYKWDFRDHTLKKTGFVLVETYPKDATVKVAGRVVSKKTPVTIKRLLPGDYLIEIDKTQYRHWQAIVKVESGMVNEQRNIMLTLENVDNQILRNKPTDLLVASPDRSKLAITSGNEISIWKTTEKTEAVVFSPDLMAQQAVTREFPEITKAQISQVNFGPDNKTLLITAMGRSSKYYLLLDSENNLIKVLARGNNMTHWDWLSNDELVFMQNGQMWLVGGGLKQPKKLTDKITDYSLINGVIYVVSKDAKNTPQIMRVDKSGSMKSENIEAPIAKNYQIYKVKNNWLLVTNNNDTKSIWINKGLLNESGQAIWEKLASNVLSDVLWTNDFIAYQSANELNVVDIRQTDWKEPQAVFESSKPMDMLLFAFDTILYVQEGRLKSIDINGSNNYELATVKSAETTDIVDSQLSKLVYINPQDKLVYEITLREKISGLIRTIESFRNRMSLSLR